MTGKAKAASRAKRVLPATAPRPEQEPEADGAAAAEQASQPDAPVTPGKAALAEVKHEIAESPGQPSELSPGRGAVVDLEDEGVLGVDEELNERCICQICKRDIKYEADKITMGHTGQNRATRNKFMFRHKLCHSTAVGLDRVAKKRGTRFLNWWNSLKKDQADKYRDIVTKNTERRTNSTPKQGKADAWDFVGFEETQESGVMASRKRKTKLLDQDEFIGYHTSADRGRKRMEVEAAEAAWEVALNDANVYKEENSDGEIEVAVRQNKTLADTEFHLEKKGVKRQKNNVDADGATAEIAPGRADLFLERGIGIQKVQGNNFSAVGGGATMKAFKVASEMPSTFEPSMINSDDELFDFDFAQQQDAAAAASPGSGGGGGGRSSGGNRPSGRAATASTTAEGGVARFLKRKAALGDLLRKLRSLLDKAEQEYEKAKKNIHEDVSADFITFAEKAGTDLRMAFKEKVGALEITLRDVNCINMEMAKCFETFAAVETGAEDLKAHVHEAADTVKTLGEESGRCARNARERNRKQQKKRNPYTLGGGGGGQGPVQPAQVFFKKLHETNGQAAADGGMAAEALDAPFDAVQSYTEPRLYRSDHSVSKRLAAVCNVEVVRDALTALPVQAAKEGAPNRGFAMLSFDSDKDKDMLAEAKTLAVHTDQSAEETDAWKKAARRMSVFYAKGNTVHTGLEGFGFGHYKYMKEGSRFVYMISYGEATARYKAATAATGGNSGAAGYKDVVAWLGAGLNSSGGPQEMVGGKAWHTVQRPGETLWIPDNWLLIEAVFLQEPCSGIKVPVATEHYMSSAVAVVMDTFKSFPNLPPAHLFWVVKKALPSA